MAPDGTYYDRELETMPWAQVQARSFAKAQAQIERCYAVSPHYQRKFDEAGVKPSDIRGPEDLAKVPFFDKHEERAAQVANPPFGEHLCVDPSELARVHASSGTTGVPTYFGLTANDLQTWDRLMGRCWYTAGVRPGDRFALLGNLAMFVGGVPALTSLSHVGACAIPLGATSGTQRTLEIARSLGTTALGATPSFAVYLAEMMPEFLGIQARDFGLRMMTVGGEPGGQIPAVREQICELWGVQLRDTMGIGEFAGLMWAESSDQAGMHFNGQAELHIELIDPDTAEPKPFEDGAHGELVYTAIEREAHPLIRFRSHDHVLVQMSPTPSGRTAPRITTLGRTDDMLLVRGINVFPSAVRDVVASFSPQTTGHIRIVLEKPGPLVSPPLPVMVEIADDVTGPDREALVARIADRMRSALSFSAEVRPVDAGTIPRTSLKTQYVVKAYEAGPDDG